MNGHSGVPIKLSWQDQVVSQTWPADYSLLTLGLGWFVHDITLVTVIWLGQHVLSWSNYAEGNLHFICDREGFSVSSGTKVEHGTPNAPSQLRCDQAGNQPQDGVQIEVGRGESWRVWGLDGSTWPCPTTGLLFVWADPTDFLIVEASLSLHFLLLDSKNILIRTRFK